MGWGWYLLACVLWVPVIGTRQEYSSWYKLLVPRGPSMPASSPRSVKSQNDIHRPTASVTDKRFNWFNFFFVPRDRLLLLPSYVNVTVTKWQAKRNSVQVVPRSPIRAKPPVRNRAPPRAEPPTPKHAFMLLSEAAAARIPEGCGIGDRQDGDDGCCGAPISRTAVLRGMGPNAISRPDLTVLLVLVVTQCRRAPRPWVAGFVRPATGSRPLSRGLHRHKWSACVQRPEVCLQSAHSSSVQNQTCPWQMRPGGREVRRARREAETRESADQILSAGKPVATDSSSYPGWSPVWIQTISVIYILLYIRLPLKRCILHFLIRS